MPIAISPPLPVEAVTLTIYDELHYKLAKPFKATLYLGTINVDLNANATAAVVGIVKKGTTKRGGTATLQVNRAKFDELRASINQGNLSITLHWDTATMLPVEITCSSGLVAVAAFADARPS